MEMIKKLRSNTQAQAVAVILMLLVCAVGAGVFAKYIYQNNESELVYAEEFYFSSDLIDGETHTLSPGTETITFTVGNHDDKLRYSEMDITYKVTVSEIGNNKTTAEVQYDESADIITDEEGNNVYKLSTGKVNDDSITLSGLESGKSYTVTATANGGYHKTLTATLVVQEETPAVYKYLETTSEYALLTVWTKGYSGDVKVKFPTDLAPDNTDSVMKDVKSINGSFTDNDSFNDSDNNKYTSHIYRFFRIANDANNYKVEDFDVSYDGGTASVATPQ